MTTATMAKIGKANLNGVENNTHHLVWQVRNARKEWALAFDGVSDEDGEKRFGRINSLGWFMAHLAWHEMLNYGALTGDMLFPELHELAGKGNPASTPKLSEMRALWEQVIEAADARLASLTVDDLLGDVNYFGMEYPENLGSVLQRTNNHYFYHMGEVAAVRQLLDHTGYPEVMAEEGAMDYYPER